LHHVCDGLGHQILLFLNEGFRIATLSEKQDLCQHTVWRSSEKSSAFTTTQ
jgi:hypothetical protein